MRPSSPTGSAEALPGTTARTVATRGPWERARWVVLALCALAWLALRLSDPVVGGMDPEEAATASQAAFLRLVTWTDAWRLQVIPACTGCTVVASTAAACFTVLGDSVLVWKAVLATFTLAVLGVGVRAFRDRDGWAAAGVFAVAWLMPPSVAANLALRGWANHYEACAVGWLCALYLARAASRRDVLLAGLWGAAAVFVGRTGGVVVAAAFLALLLGRRWRDAATFALGVLPVLPVLALVAWFQGEPVSGQVSHGLGGLRPLAELGALRALTSPGAWGVLLGLEGWPWVGVAVLVALLASARAVLVEGDVLGRTAWGVPVVLLFILAVFRVPIEAHGVPEHAQRYLVGLSMAVPFALAAAWTSPSGWRLGRRALVAVGVGLLATGSVWDAAQRARWPTHLTVRAPGGPWGLGRLACRSLARPLTCAEGDADCVVAEAWQRGGTLARVSRAPAEVDGAQVAAAFGLALGCEGGSGPPKLHLVDEVPEPWREVARAFSSETGDVTSPGQAMWRGQLAAPRYRTEGVTVPPLPAPSARAWAYGVGLAVGHRYGPTWQVPGVAQLADPLREALSQGQERGARSPLDRVVAEGPFWIAGAP